MLGENVTMFAERRAMLRQAVGDRETTKEGIKSILSDLINRAEYIGIEGWALDSIMEILDELMEDYKRK